jgi:hypothetical protein
MPLEYRGGKEERARPLSGFHPIQNPSDRTPVVKERA